VQDNDTAPREMSKRRDDYIASDMAKKAMRYHGISTLISEPDKKQSYFFRNGKKVFVKFPDEEYDRVLNLYDPSRR